MENRCQAGKNNRSLVNTLPHSSHVAIQIHFSKIKICTHIVCVLEPQVVHKYSKTEMMALHSRGLLYSIFSSLKALEIALRVKPKQQRRTGLTLTSKSCHLPTTQFTQSSLLPNRAVVRFKVRCGTDTP